MEDYSTVMQSVNNATRLWCTEKELQKINFIAADLSVFKTKLKSLKTSVYLSEDRKWKKMLRNK